RVVMGYLPSPSKSCSPTTGPLVVSGYMSGKVVHPSPHWISVEAGCGRLGPAASLTLAVVTLCRSPSPSTYELLVGVDVKGASYTSMPVCPSARRPSPKKTPTVMVYSPHMSYW